MTDQRLILRVSLKLMITFSIVWVIYILTIGFFDFSDLDGKSEYTFDLSTLPLDQHRYFKIENRELLVIKNDKKYFVYWAHDPIYGCKLEVINSFIKPICIDIKYSLNGYSTEKKQQLKSPKHKIDASHSLFIYL